MKKVCDGDIGGGGDNSSDRGGNTSDDGGSCVSVSGFSSNDSIYCDDEDTSVG